MLSTAVATIDLHTIVVVSSRFEMEVWLALAPLAAGILYAPPVTAGREICGANAEWRMGFRGCRFLLGMDEWMGM